MGKTMSLEPVREFSTHSQAMFCSTPSESMTTRWNATHDFLVGSFHRREVKLERAKRYLAERAKDHPEWTTKRMSGGA